MSDSERLIEIHRRLPESAQAELMNFAEFLAQRHPPAEPEVVEGPRHVPRPDEESVVAAIKRLSGVYHMLDRSKMLHETSGLMAEHLMQGRPAAEVIDELEGLFEKYYIKQFGDED